MSSTTGPTVTELRALRGNMADELSALFTHSWDLRQVDGYLAYCIDGEPGREPFLMDMAWDAAIVRYFRAWGMTGSRALAEVLEAAPAEQRTYHYALKDVRDKLIAHHRRLGTVCQTVLVSEVDARGGARITNVSCFQVRISQLGESHAERFMQLIRTLGPIADQLAEVRRSALLKDVSGKARDEVRKMALVDRGRATERIVRDVGF